MNFFEQQKRARRNTAWLVGLYLAAVVGILIAIDLLINALYLFEGGLGVHAQAPASVHGFALAVAAAVILGATAYKVIQLADGGEAVVAMVGARRITPQTGDLAEKRLLNVVEEMAIASGTAVPGVYVMDGEAAINAFAAGYEPNEAVIAVTRGALEKLNRDELQGVIGHEFSHILNGDMRINVRMMGVLFGIVCIGSIGRFLLRSMSESRSSRSRDAGSAQVAIGALGLGLVLIGWIGVFFARIIKAAVSRQREFLADASSVQFTRNPDGLAGALDRIGVTSAGTLIGNRYAEELSHMFFGQSVKMFLAGLMDTHPPLEERVRRVRPGFQRGVYRNRRAEEERAAIAAQERDRREDLEAWGGAAAVSLAAEHAGAQPPAASAPLAQPARIVASVGNPSDAHVRYAHGLLDSIPPMLRMMAGEPAGAQALTLALVLAHDETERAGQIAALKQLDADALLSLASAPAMLVHKLGPAFVLPLLDLAMPALRTLHGSERTRLLALLRCAVEADRKVTLQEFALLAIAEKRLAAHAGRAEPLGKRTLIDLQTDVELTLSLLARAGHSDEQWARIAFERAAVALRLNERIRLLAHSAVRLEHVSDALQRLRELAPEYKARLLEACVLAVSADEAIHVREAELVRLLASEFDLPLPPILL